MEAIVALVLLSTSGIALFSWISNTLNGLNHALENAKKSQHRQNALALIQQVNPALEQTGQIKRNDYTLTWKASPITPMNREITLSGTAGPYLLGLFDTKISIFKSGQLLDEFTLRQIGYQASR